MGYGPSGNKNSDTTDFYAKGNINILQNNKTVMESYLLFSFRKYYIILALWTRIQHFRDLRRKYDRMSLSAHCCYFFFHQKHKFVHILVAIFHFFFSYAVTYLHVNMSIYTYRGVFFFGRYRVWKDILNSINLN